MIYTCGIFLIKSSDKKLLIAHPTNSKGLNNWSIPKGRLDKNEKPIDASVREMIEEANIDLNEFKYDCIRLSPVMYKSKKKTLIPFLLYISDDFYNSVKDDIKCTSYVEPTVGDFLENDDFKWISIYDENINKILNKAQLEALDEIKNNHI